MSRLHVQRFNPEKATVTIRFTPSPSASVPFPNDIPLTSASMDRGIHLPAGSYLVTCTPTPVLHLRLHEVPLDEGRSTWLPRDRG